MKDRFTKEIIRLAEVAGPETHANFYEAEGYSMFNHVVIDRPDLRDPFTAKEMPNPSRAEFDPIIVGFLSGIIKNSILDSDETQELADEVAERMAYKLTINTSPVPDAITQARFDKWTQNRVTEFSKQLDNVVGFPQEFAGDAPPSGEDALYIPSGNFGIVVPELVRVKVDQSLDAYNRYFRDREY